MPGIDIGALLANVGGMLLSALTNAFQNTLSGILTRAITAGLQGLADTVIRTFQLQGWLADALTDFTRNLTTELTQMTSSLLNSVNKIAQQAWGIADAQQRLHQQLASIVDQSVGALAHALNLEQERQYKAGAAVTELLLRMLVHDKEKFESFGANVLTYQMDMERLAQMSHRDLVDTALGYVRDYIMADLRVIEAMPEQDLQYVSSYLFELLQDRAKEVYEWFRDVVLTPVSFANAFRSMLREGLMYSEDEVAEQFLAHQKAVDKAMAKYAEELAKKALEVAPE